MFPQSKVACAIAWMISAVAVFATQRAIAADTWFTFTDPDLAFTVGLPGTPTVTHDNTNKTADGKVIPSVMYEVDHGAIAFIVSASDFSGTQSDPGKAIDGGVAAVRSDASTIIADQISILDGQVGHELIFTDKDGSRFDDRVYFTKEHLYQVLVVIAKDPTADQVADASRFLASFHFSKN